MKTKEEILDKYIETVFSHTKIVESDNALKAMQEYVDEARKEMEGKASKKDFHELQERAYQIAKDHGFWEDRKNFGEVIALIHSELSEALEAHRKNLNDDKLSHRSGVEVELADAMIRIFDAAEGYGMDLKGAVEEKLAYNMQRPYKHGKHY